MSAEPSADGTFPEFTSSFLAALERLAIASRLPAPAQRAGEARSRVRGRALEFSDFRPYVPGDDPRLVDWRAYARLGRLYLKQYAEERARTLTLLLDASASLDWGTGDAHKGRYARRLAAALAWISLARHEPVRAFLLRDGQAEPLRPHASRAGTVAFFRDLGGVREGGTTGLAAAVRSALSAPAPGPVVLLSDLLDPTWPEALAAIARAGQVAAIQVLAPDEWNPPPGDEVELEDAETGALRATRLGPPELAEYRARLEAFLADVRRQAGRAGVLHLALNTATPLEAALLRHLPAAGLLVQHA